MKNAISELVETLRHINVSKGKLLSDFWTAYEERAEDKMLRESHGLSGALYGLLAFPPHRYLDVANAPAVGDSLHPERMQKIEAGLEAISASSPHIIELPRRYCGEVRRSLEEVLSAQLIGYHRTRNNVWY